MTSSSSSRAGNPWAAFAVTTAAAALTILDLSKVNVGLPSIETSLGASPTELQLVVSAYALAFGIALIPSGRIGDLGSRKLMLTLGVTVFTVASLLGAVAPTPVVLLIGRVLQGIGAGMLMPQVIGFTQQLFQGAARGRAFGVFGGTVGVATALGPTLGGALVTWGGEIDGWRWLFWLNVPLGILILIFAWRLLPGTQPHSVGDRTPGHRSLDPIGVLLIAVATISLLIPFALTTGQGGDDPNRWWWLIPAVVALVGFGFWEKAYERRGKSPVIHLGLLSVSSFRNGLIVVSGFFAATPAMLILITLFLQQGLGWSAIAAGAASIPYALISAVISWWSGGRAMRKGRTLIILGLSITLVGAFALITAAALLPEATVGWGVVVALTVIGAGSGFVMSPNQTLLLSEVPLTHGGVAASVGQLGQRVGTAIGVAVASAVFFSTLATTGDEPYERALGTGMVAVAAFVLLALVAAIVDWAQHRTTQTPASAENAAMEGNSA